MVAEGDGSAQAATGYVPPVRTLLLALVVLIFAVGVVASIVMIRGIRISAKAIVAQLTSLRTNDVTALRNGLRRLAEGDVTLELRPVTLRIERRTRDEIGDIAEAVGEIRDHTVASVEAYNTSRAALAAMIGQVSHTAGTMSSASHQLATGSEEARRAVDEIASATEEMAAGAERQVRAIASASKLIEEVAAATNQSADGASETAVAADEAPTTRDGRSRRGARGDGRHGRRAGGVVRCKLGNRRTGSQVRAHRQRRRDDHEDR